MSERVFITSLHLMHGGIEKSITSLANALDENGFTVEILCTYKLGTPVYHINPGVKIRYLTNLKPNKHEFDVAIKSKNPLKIIKEGTNAAKVLYQKSHSMKLAIKCIDSGAIISTRHENSKILSKYGASTVKKIAQLHVDHAFDRRLFSDFCKKYNRIDYFALLTQQSAKEVRDAMRSFNNHTKVISIPNFIDGPFNVPLQERAKQVISVGRLHHEKDFASLLEIWSLVAPIRPGWKLKIIGGGELKTSLTEKAQQLSVSDSISFAGELPHEEVIKEMAISRCYALTSLYESFGIALVESMSCGTPAVAFDVRVGPAYIITEGVDGYLIPGRDKLAFAHKLGQLMDDATLCEQMGEKARDSATRFFMHEVIKEWKKILRQSCDI